MKTGRYREDVFQNGEHRVHDSDFSIAEGCPCDMDDISYITQPPAYEQISGLTFGTLTEEHRSRSRSSWDWKDVTFTALVLALILTAYLYFTG